MPFSAQRIGQTRAPRAMRPSVTRSSALLGARLLCSVALLACGKSEPTIQAKPGENAVRQASTAAPSAGAAAGGAPATHDHAGHDHGAHDHGHDHGAHDHGEPSAQGGAGGEAALPPYVANLDGCTAHCQEASHALGCPRPDSCAEACTKLDQATVCKPQVQRYIECFVRQRPRAGLKCDPYTGMATLNHTCEPEENAVTDCAMKHRKF